MTNNNNPNRMALLSSDATLQEPQTSPVSVRGTNAALKFASKDKDTRFLVPEYFG